MLEKIVLNHPNIDKLLKGAEVAAMLAEKGEAVRTAADANSGRQGDHRVESTITASRARTAIITDTFNAMHREADSRSLTRALDAAR